MSDYGRIDFVEETTDRQIASTNRHVKSKGNHELLVQRGQIEDHNMCKGLEISVEELNQGRAQK